VKIFSNYAYDLCNYAQLLKTTSMRQMGSISHNFENHKRLESVFL